MNMDILKDNEEEEEVLDVLEILDRYEDDISQEVLSLETSSTDFHATSQRRRSSFFLSQHVESDNAGELTAVRNLLRKSSIERKRFSPRSSNSSYSKLGRVDSFSSEKETSAHIRLSRGGKRLSVLLGDIGEDVLKDETEPVNNLLESEQQGGAAGATAFLNLVKKTVSSKNDTIFATWYDSNGDATDEYTFGELWIEAGVIAHHLRQKWHLAKGDRVVLCYNFGLSFLASFLGCLRAGVVAVLVYPPSLPLIKSLTKMSKVVNDCDAKLVLTDPDVSLLRKADTLNPFSKSRQLWPKNIEFKDTTKLGQATLIKRAFSGKKAERDSFDEVDITPSDIAFLQYTSGSTGDPKGVMITFGALAANVSLLHTGFSDGYAVDGGIPETFIGCSWLPQYHDLGLVMGNLVPLAYGYPMHMFSPMDFIRKPLLWLQLISRERVSWGAAPNFAFHLTARKFTEAKEKNKKQLLPGLDLSCIGKMQVCAEPVQLETKEVFESVFRQYGLREDWFLTAYGLAEHVVGVSWIRGLHMSVPRPDEDLARLVAVGSRQSLPATSSVRIVDPYSFSQVADGKTGEVWVSSPSVAAGYFNKPDLTQEVFHATIADSSDTMKYLRTGDLGFFQNDKLFICGRQKDLIIVNGVNYYPQDVEFAVQDSSPAVRPGCIAAFSSDDTGKDGSLEIVFEMKRIDVDSAKIVIATVLSQVTERVGLRPSRVVAIQEKSIPKTTSGKIQRKATRAALHSSKLKIVLDYKTGELLVPRAIPQAQAGPVLHKEESSVCILGAGPGGLSLAHFLQKRGYTKVHVYEKDENVGGKAKGVWCGSRKQYVGSGQYTVNQGYSEMKALSKEFGVELFGKPFGDGSQISYFDTNTGKFTSSSENLASTSDLDPKSQQDLRGVLRAANSLPPTGFVGIPDEMHDSLSNFMQERNMTSSATKALLTSLNQYAPAGYLSTSSSVPAANWLKLAQQPGQGWSYVAPDGFRLLCEALETKISSVDGSKVFVGTPIDRIRHMDHGGVNVWAEGKEQQYDNLVITGHLSDVVPLMDDASKEELRLAEQLATTDYVVTLAIVSGMPPCTYVPNNWEPGATGRVFLVSETQYDDGIDDHGKLYSVFQYGTDYETGRSLTEATLMEMLRADVATFGGSVLSIEASPHRWQYFPHPRLSALKDGFYERLEALQGSKSTFFAGSTLNFELTETTVKYSKALVERFFPPVLTTAELQVGSSVTEFTPGSSHTEKMKRLHRLEKYGSYPTEWNHFLADFDDYVEHKMKTFGSLFPCVDYDGGAYYMLTRLEDCAIVFDPSKTEKANYIGAWPEKLFRSSSCMNGKDHDVRKQLAMDFMKQQLPEDLGASQVEQITLQHIRRWGRFFDQKNSSVIDLSPLLTTLWGDVIRDLFVKKPIANFHQCVEDCFRGSDGARIAAKETFKRLLQNNIDLSHFELDSRGLSDDDALEQLTSILAVAAYPADPLKSVLGELILHKESRRKAMQDKTYMQCCIMEAFRCHTGIEIISARLYEDTTICGQDLPKGTLLKANIGYGLRCDESAFENPSQFSPDRWRGPNAVQKSHPDAVQLMFGLGSGASARSCPARNFVLVAMERIVSTIFKHSQFEQASDVVWERRHQWSRCQPTKIEVSQFKTSDEADLSMSKPDIPQYGSDISMRPPGWSWPNNDKSSCRINVSHYHISVGSDINMHVAVAGEGHGVPLLLLHGIPECSYSWAPHLESLVSSRQGQVLIPDLRGFGETESLPAQGGKILISDLVTDLVGLLDKLEVHKVVVAGHDLGAIVAWSLSALHPSRVAGICAIGISDLALDQIGGNEDSSVPPLARIRKARAQGSNPPLSYPLDLASPSVGRLLDANMPSAFMGMYKESTPTLEMLVKSDPTTDDDTILPSDLLDCLLKGTKLNPLSRQFQIYAGLDDSWTALKHARENMGKSSRHTITDKLPVLLFTCGLDTFWSPNLCSSVVDRFPLTKEVLQEKWTHWCLGQPDAIGTLGQSIVSWLNSLEINGKVEISTTKLEQSTKQKLVDGDQIASQLSQPRQVDQESFISQVTAVVAKTLSVDEDGLDAGMSFVEMGLDSLAAAQLVDELSDGIGMKLDSSIFYEYPTITELAKYLSDKASPSSGLVSVASYQEHKQSMTDQIQAILSGMLETSTSIDTHVPFTQMGLDSLAAAQLVDDLSEKIECEISPALLFDYPTIDALTEYILSNSSGVVESGGLEHKKVIATTMAILAKLLGTRTSELNEGSTFTEVGLDSLAVAQLVDELNEAFCIELSATAVFDYPTVDALAQHICTTAGIPVGGRPETHHSRNLQATMASMLKKIPRENWDRANLDDKEKKILETVLPSAREGFSKWFVPLRVGGQKWSDGCVLLFCFHGIAGNASFGFGRLGDRLPSFVFPYAICLPGNEHRSKEPFPADSEAFIKNVSTAITAFAGDRPFVLFGHSLGGLIAYMAAKTLKKEGVSPVSTIIACASTPQHFHVGKRVALKYLRLAKSEGKQLEREVYRYLNFAYLVSEQSKREWAADPSLGCPLCVVGGAKDDMVPVSKLKKWSNVTGSDERMGENDGRYSVTVIKGGDHFVPNDPNALNGKREPYDQFWKIVREELVAACNIDGRVQQIPESSGMAPIEAEVSSHPQLLRMGASERIFMSLKIDIVATSIFRGQISAREFTERVQHVITSDPKWIRFRSKGNAAISRWKPIPQWNAANHVNDMQRSDGRRKGADVDWYFQLSSLDNNDTIVELFVNHGIGDGYTMRLLGLSICDPVQSEEVKLPKLPPGVQLYQMRNDAKLRKVVSKHPIPPMSPFGKNPGIVEIDFGTFLLSDVKAYAKQQGAKGATVNDVLLQIVSETKRRVGESHQWLACTFNQRGLKDLHRMDNVSDFLPIYVGDGRLSTIRKYTKAVKGSTLVTLKESRGLVRGLGGSGDIRGLSNMIGNKNSDQLFGAECVSSKFFVQNLFVVYIQSHNGILHATFGVSEPQRERGEEISRSFDLVLRNFGLRTATD